MSFRSSLLLVLFVLGVDPVAAACDFEDSCEGCAQDRCSWKAVVQTSETCQAADNIPPDCVAATPVDPTSASTTTPAPGGAVGDPHLFGPSGDRFDFKGKNATWYALLSAATVSVGAYFVFDTFHMRKKLVHGSWMKGIAITAMMASNNTLKAAYFSNSSYAAEIRIGTDGMATLKRGETFEGDGVKVALSTQNVFTLSNREWSIEAKNIYAPYPRANRFKTRLDISIKPIANVDASPVAPHGLVGQMYDRDDKMVVGKMDDYMVKDKVIVTSAMGEGAIEGTADDYIIDAKDPFDTKFKFSRFGLSFAPPRNVSLLTGIVLPAVGSSTGSAGGVNDEADN